MSDKTRAALHGKPGRYYTHEGTTKTEDRWPKNEHSLRQAQRDREEAAIAKGH